MLHFSSSGTLGFHICELNNSFFLFYSTCELRLQAFSENDMGLSLFVHFSENADGFHFLMLLWLEWLFGLFVMHSIYFPNLPRMLLLWCCSCLFLCMEHLATLSTRWVRLVITFLFKTHFSMANRVYFVSSMVTDYDWWIVSSRGLANGFRSVAVRFGLNSDPLGCRYISFYFRFMNICYGYYR